MAKFRIGWKKLERAIQQNHVTVRDKPARKKRAKRVHKRRKLNLHSDLLFRLRF